MKIQIKRFFCSQNELHFLFDQFSKKTQQPFFKVYSSQIEILRDPIDFYVYLHVNFLFRKESNRVIKEQAQVVFTQVLEIQKNIWFIYYLDSNYKQQNKKKQKISSFNTFRFLQRNQIKQNPGIFIRDYISFKKGITFKKENQHNTNIKIGFFSPPLNNPVLYDYNTSALREIFGVHHMKFYIFDDNVLITGANLSEDYFTTRQDRYFLVKDCPDLANYLFDLLGTLVSNSQVVDQMEILQTINHQPQARKKRKFTEIFNHQFKMFLFSHKQKFVIQLSQLNDFEEEMKLNNDKNYCQKFNMKYQGENESQLNQESCYNEESIDEQDLAIFKQNNQIKVQLQQQKEKAKIILEQSFDHGEVSNIVRRIENALYQDKQYDLVNLGGYVYIFPVINIPFINYKKDEDLFLNFLNQVQEQNTIYWSTPYFNMPIKFQNLIKQKKYQLHILTAHPKSNGFYEAGRIKKYIPRLYRYLLQKFLNENQKSKVYEWLDPNRTFHSKGIWLQDINKQFPFTIIGSSNYSQRSYERDTELQFYIYSQCSEFQRHLKDEQQQQFEKSQTITNNELKQDKQNQLGFFMKKLSFFLKKFL